PAQALHRPGPREGPQRARRSHQPLEPRPLIEAQDGERRAGAPGLGEHRIDEALQEAPPGWRTVAPELGACRLEERAEADAGGTRALAGSATETAVEVAGEGLGQLGVTIGWGPQPVP